MRPIRVVPLTALVACASLRPGIGNDEATWDGWPVATPGEAANRVETRLATWNVESLGEPGTDEFIAVEEVLTRLDADVLVLQEIAQDQGAALQVLANDLGYAFAAKADEVPFGNIGVAGLSRLPDTTLTFPTSAELSGDPAAYDLTRLPVVVTFPVGEVRVSFVGTHLKSGSADADAFRRCVDAVRAGQASAASDADVRLLAGDLNDDVVDIDPSTPPWRAGPDDLPSSYVLGRDLRARLTADGLEDDLFGLLRAAGLGVLEARQRDGSDTTRAESGRRIDYFLGDATVQRASWRAEVYDPNDETLEGIPLSGDPLQPDAVSRAADHFPILGILGL